MGNCELIRLQQPLSGAANPQQPKSDGSTDFNIRHLLRGLLGLAPVTLGDSPLGPGAKGLGLGQIFAVPLLFSQLTSTSC